MTPKPFVISTHDLGRRPGSMRTLQRTITLEEAMGTEVIAVPAGSDLELDLRLEAVMEGVLVTGTASAGAVGECVRCLGPVRLDLTADLTELFAYPGTRHPEASEEGEDIEPLPEMRGEMLDLEGTVTDAVVLGLPFQPLCRPDCPGLCPVCGIRLEDAEEGHAHSSIDPRWAALAGLGSDEPAGEAPDRDPDS